MAPFMASYCCSFSQTAYAKETVEKAFSPRGVKQS